MIRDIDARGWIGIGIFALTVAALAMLVIDPTLRENEFYKTIATLIVGAFIKDVVGWAFSATQAGGELARRNADIVQQGATAANVTVPADAKDAARQTADAAEAKAEQIEGASE